MTLVHNNNVPSSLYTKKPEYENFSPPATAEEFGRIKNSIKLNGLTDKIVLNQNRVVIEGHTRLKAIEELAIPITEELFEIKYFASEEDEIGYIINKNFDRKHHSKFVLVEIFDEKIGPYYANLALTNQKAGTSVQNCTKVGRVTEQIAKLAGCTKSYVDSVRTVKKYGTTDVCI